MTCGYIETKPLEDLCTMLDAAQVDLKSFDERTYRRLNSGKLQPVLDAIVTINRLGVWLELSYLVVPTYADDMEGIRRLCGWITQKLGPDHPLHFLRFHPQHRLANLPPTPLDTMTAARDVATKAGLRYVYLGNVREISGCDTTTCPHCGKTAIDREGWLIRNNNVDEDGKCRSCGGKIAGVFKA